MSLPSLPVLDIPWSSAVYSANEILRESYRTASNLLSLSSPDPQRLAYHLQNIAREVVPLLSDLADCAEEEGLPLAWLNQCADRFGTLLVQLDEAERSAVSEETSNIMYPKLVRAIHTGRRGRPQKTIDVNFLRKAMDPKRRLTLTQLAGALQISQQTLASLLRKHHIDYGYTALSNSELDDMVKRYRRQKPGSGIRYLDGHLRRNGIKLTKCRLSASIRRVDRLGNTLHRRLKAQKKRKVFEVLRPNALWCIDGHHKLILSGIVIHGCVDAYSRKITGLRANTDNKASTVLQMFMQACRKYRMPSRVRGDQGGENRDVSVMMILRHGLNRGSFIWGSSTHNRDWNAHPISGEGHDRSPNDLYFLGKLKHGAYKDDCKGIDADTIACFYGIYGDPVQRRPHQTGAGHPLDEDSDGESEPDSESGSGSSEGSDISGDEMGDAVAEQEGQIKHDAVKTPRHQNPFHGNPQRQAHFAESLWELSVKNFVPRGYGVWQTEWGSGRYPSFEII
ncbi:hypothetical protein D9758_014882 [Tetrapyrgos nigripes]|uniref:Integrase catalytic domain-containing protein n=1 Tax=Tetrapyrgos nigripes TaxID=182062 RepID=A0A8H5FK95_9AGAR|nr:hypothetical protein D9758_014882 [Tetrapyrgos nigripes]